MAEILEAREKKQLELSHENMDLVESNNDLRRYMNAMKFHSYCEISLLFSC